MKRFSIIIPAYNSAQYIEECLNSIIKQDYNDFEIILINDNSQDKTEFKIKKIRKKYPNVSIKYFSNKKNIGPGACRNIGIDNSEGEYLLFFDSDDYLVDDKVLVEIDKKLRKEHQPDILIFGSVMNYKKSDETSIIETLLIPRKKEENKKYQLTKKIIRFIWPMCVKRKLIIENKVKFQEDIYIYEDVIFRSQIIAYAQKIKTYSKVCYNYNRRLNRETTSSDANIGITHKLKKLAMATKRINELAINEDVPLEEIKTFKRTMLLFFPGIIVIIGNHLLSKLATKIQCKNE